MSLRQCCLWGFLPDKSQGGFPEGDTVLIKSMYIYVLSVLSVTVCFGSFYCMSLELTPCSLWEDRIWNIPCKMLIFLEANNDVWINSDYRTLQNSFCKLGFSQSLSAISENILLFEESKYGFFLLFFQPNSPRIHVVEQNIDY